MFRLLIIKENSLFEVESVTDLGSLQQCDPTVVEPKYQKTTVVLFLEFYR